MKKKILGIIGLLWSTTTCVHLPLDTSQKIDFTNKRIMMIEKTIAQKLNEKAVLEQKLVATNQTPKEMGSLALLQGKLLAIDTDITALQESITVAKNSVKSLLT